MMINGQLCDDMNCIPCMMADMDATVAANGSNVYVVEQTAPETTRFLKPGQGAGRGKRGTRKISDRQVAFILSLIDRKITSGITLYPGQTLNPTEIGNMGLPAGRALIDKLINCPDKPRTSHSVKVTDQGSEKQRAFLASLIAQTNSTEADINAQYSTIREAIDALIKLSKSQPRKVSTVEITEGMYNTDGEIFKVQRSKSSGRLYAMKLNGSKFEYAPGAMRSIKAEDKMSLEDAKEYGKRTGQCCNCGRELTKQESIDAGIGPICASKF